MALNKENLSDNMLVECVFVTYILDNYLIDFEKLFSEIFGKLRDQFEPCLIYTTCFIQSATGEFSILVVLVHKAGTPTMIFPSTEVGTIKQRNAYIVQHFLFFHGQSHAIQIKMDVGLSEVNSFSGTFSINCISTDLLRLEGCFSIPIYVHN